MFGFQEKQLTCWFWPKNICLLDWNTFKNEKKNPTPTFCQLFFGFPQNKLLSSNLRSAGCRRQWALCSSNNQADKTHQLWKINQNLLFGDWFTSLNTLKAGLCTVITSLLYILNNVKWLYASVSIQCVSSSPVNPPWKEHLWILWQFGVRTDHDCNTENDWDNTLI